MAISENFTPWTALLGGALIGLSTVAVYALNGAIAGISGVTARLLPGASGARPWRAAFLVGLIAGAGTTFALLPATRAFAAAPALPWLIVAGLLVGIGTRLGGGCTSGHGVCGISRGRIHSIVATLTFMAVAFATVAVTHHLLGGEAQ